MVKAAFGAQSLRGAACRAGKHHPPQGSAQQAGLLAAGRAGAELQSPRPGRSPRNEAEVASAVHPGGGEAGALEAAVSRGAKAMEKALGSSTSQGPAGQEQASLAAGHTVTAVPTTKHHAEAGRRYLDNRKTI